MHSNCILDSVANLLDRHMAFVGNVQKSPIAFHLKGSDPSLVFCCPAPALTCIKEWDQMGVRIRLTLETNEISLHMIFSLERADVVRALLERISGFDPSLEMIAPRYLKFSFSSSLRLFIFISNWKPFWLFVIHFVLSVPISFLYLWWLYRGDVVCQSGLSSPIPEDRYNYDVSIFCISPLLEN